MNVFYAVIDTNVLVSAMLKFNSIPGTIFQLVANGNIKPLYNETIINEYKEVLLRNKFHLTEEIVNNIINIFVTCGIKTTAKNIDIQMPDQSDKVFYEVAMEGRKINDCYLITENMKHFPNKPFILTPKEMLNLIIQDTTKI